MPNSFKAKSLRELLLQSELEAESRKAEGKPLLLSPPPVFDAAKDEATVYVYDAIGGWWGVDPKTWVPEFSAIKAKTIHLRINSPGGSVFDAEAMRTAIRQHSANVIAHIDGMAASAATGIAIAADEVEISDGAMFMIHHPWGWAAGNAQEMREYADLLDKVDSSIVAAYVKKSGQDEKQIRDWMDKETWFTATEALANGFVDKIFEAEDSADSDEESAIAAMAELEKFKMQAHRQLLWAESSVAGLFRETATP